MPRSMGPTARPWGGEAVPAVKMAPKLEEIAAKMAALEEERRTLKSELDIYIESDAYREQVDNEEAMQCADLELNRGRQGLATLCTNIRNLSQVAEKSSRRVKQMDKAKRRVEECLSILNAATTYEGSRETMKSCLQNKEWAAAAKAVNEFKTAEQQLRESDTMELVEEEESEAAVNLREELSRSVQEEFLQACKKCETNRVDELAMLLTPLGVTDGITMYLTYKENLLRGHLETMLAEIRDKNGMDKGAGLICRQLADHTIGEVESNEEEVKAYFGQDCLLPLQESLFKVCDEVLSPVVDALKQSMQRMFERRNPQQVVGPEVYKAADEVLNQAASLAYDLTILTKNIQERSPGKRVSFLHTSKLIQSADNLMMNEFLQLQTYYFEITRQDLEQEFPDGSPEEEKQGSPIIADTFFILRLFIRRAIQTQNEQVVQSTMKCICDDVLVRLKEVLERRGQQKGMQMALLSLNDLERACTFTATNLPKDFSTALNSTENIGFSQNELSKIRQQTDEILQNAIGPLKELRERELGGLVGDLWVGVKGHLVKFDQVNYNIGEEEFNAHDANDPWVVAFLEAVTDRVGKYRLLNPPNRQELLKMFLKQVVAYMEDQVIGKGKPISQWGNLQLQKDLSALQKFFGEAMEVAVRSYFSKLLSIEDN